MYKEIEFNLAKLIITDNKLQEVEKHWLQKRTNNVLKKQEKIGRIGENSS